MPECVATWPSISITTVSIRGGGVTELFSRFIKSLNFMKASGPDKMLVVVLKNLDPELSTIADVWESYIP